MSERDRLNSSLSASHLISRLLIRRVFYAPMDAIFFFFFSSEKFFEKFLASSVLYNDNFSGEIAIVIFCFNLTYKK